MVKKKNKNHRAGELDALYFDKLPQRCKEIFFEYSYLYCMGEMQSNPSGFILVSGLYIDEECKSPIEQILAFALSIVSYEKEDANKPTLYLTSQKCIEANNCRYYADLYFDTNYILEEGFKACNDLKLVIECDGHEFHEKTKEQVIKGNERDYNLKLSGYEVLHFSGSQIFNEPLKCAFEIFDYIEKRVGGWTEIDVGD